MMTSKNQRLGTTLLRLAGGLVATSALVVGLDARADGG